MTPQQYYCYDCGEFFDECDQRNDLFDVYDCCPYCGGKEFYECDEDGEPLI